MESTTKRLIDYETSNGECPIRTWLESLDVPISARIEARLQRVALGNMGDAKPVGQGVAELRFTFGSGYRVYFASHGDDVVILLCGGDKGSQSNDIETAISYWLDFKRRNNA